MWQLCGPNGCVGRVGSTIAGLSKEALHGHLLEFVTLADPENT